MRTVVFGASGKTGKYIMRKLHTQNDIELTAFVRNPEKLENRSVHIIQGDALIYEDVVKALAGQDVLVASLEGDVLTMAENIVKASAHSNIRQIIWITGMGIHNEIKGSRGVMLRMLAKSRPEYIQAADLIASCGIDCTLLRCPGIEDGDSETKRMI